jgi:transcriptional regulator with XRE-family HTH domain
MSPLASGSTPLQIMRGRKAAGWTQAELAARAGVRPETISHIETGRHSPGLKTMAKIDRALNHAGGLILRHRSQCPVNLFSHLPARD